MAIAIDAFRSALRILRGETTHTTFRRPLFVILNEVKDLDGRSATRPLSRRTPGCRSARRGSVGREAPRHGRDLLLDRLPPTSARARAPCCGGRTPRPGPRRTARGRRGRDGRAAWRASAARVASRWRTRKLSPPRPAMTMSERASPAALSSATNASSSQREPGLWTSASSSSSPLSMPIATWASPRAASSRQSVGSCFSPLQTSTKLATGRPGSSRASRSKIGSRREVPSARALPSARKTERRRARSPPSSSLTAATCAASSSPPRAGTAGPGRRSRRCSGSRCNPRWPGRPPRDTGRAAGWRSDGRSARSGRARRAGAPGSSARSRPPTARPGPAPPGRPMSRPPFRRQGQRLGEDRPGLVVPRASASAWSRCAAAHGGPNRGCAGRARRRARRSAGGRRGRKPPPAPVRATAPSPSARG